MTIASPAVPGMIVSMRERMIPPTQGIVKQKLIEPRHPENADFAGSRSAGGRHGSEVTCERPSLRSIKPRASASVSPGGEVTANQWNGSSRVSED